MISAEESYGSEPKSRFTHGAVYHALFDGPLAESRRVVAELIPQGSRVLDIACGTGELCFELCSRRNCRVVGVDLSPRMIDYAQRRNQYDNVTLILGDGTSLSQMEAKSFDFATILFLLHEIPREEQIKVVAEAVRLARHVVLVDSRCPLPRNAHGIALRVVEAIGGPDHYNQFAGYLKAGGMDGILSQLQLPAAIVHRSVFWHNCREIVILAE